MISVPCLRLQTELRTSESDVKTWLLLRLLCVSQKRAFRPPFMNKCDQMRNWAYYLRVCVCAYVHARVVCVV